VAPTGEHFGSYKLISRLGKGGMGETWHAVRDDGQGVSKDVVIKRILRSVSDDPAFVEAFISEARLSSRLSHGNVAQVFEFGEVQGEYFMAMEFVAGQSLAGAIGRSIQRGLRGVPPAFALYVTMEMLKGLHHAHKRNGPDGKPLNIVHRDVSPDNVLLSYEGEVKMVDFGIAKAQLAGRAETEPGMVKGKYLYFSPEQARAEAVDARTDVFATGVVLYSMLSGRLPLEGQSHVVLHKLVKGEWPLLSAVAPWVPESVDRVVRKALAPNRNDRYPSALEFQQALAQPLREIAPEASQLTVSGMMTWLFGQELSQLGRTVVVPGPIQRMVQAHQRETTGGRPATPMPAQEPEQKLVTGEAGPTDPGGIAHVNTTPGMRVQRKNELVRYAAIGGAAIALTAAIIYGVSQDEPKQALTELDQARAAVERGDLDQARRIIEVCKSHGPCIGGDALINGAQRQVVREVEKQAKDSPGPPPSMAEVDKMIAAGDWTDARFTLTLMNDPDAKKKVELLDAEDVFKMKLDTAEMLISAGNLVEARQMIADAEKTTLLRDRLAAVKAKVDAAAATKKAPVTVSEPGDVVKKLLEQGRGQLKNRDFAGAKKTFSECLKVDNRAYDCAKLLGSAYAKLNDPDKSVLYYKKYLELAPPDDPGRATVKQILDSVGR
jgi:serine/threonine-protein kinase